MLFCPVPTAYHTIGVSDDISKNTLSFIHANAVVNAVPKTDQAPILIGRMWRSVGYNKYNLFYCYDHSAGGFMSTLTWRLVRQHAGLRLLTRFNESDAHARIQGVVPFAAADIIAILREFDLAPTWNTPALALTDHAKNDSRAATFYALVTCPHRIASSSRTGLSNAARCSR